MHIAYPHPSPSKNLGFTLVELITVLVILAVLAAVALPRFVNLQQSARIASLQSMLGSIQSTSQMVHVTCYLQPSCAQASWGASVYMNAFGQKVRILRGYVDAGEFSRTDEIDSLMDWSAESYVLTSELNQEAFRWSIPNTTNCYVQYRQPKNIAGSTLTITLETSGC